MRHLVIIVVVSVLMDSTNGDSPNCHNGEYSCIDVIWYPCYYIHCSRQSKSWVLIVGYHTNLACNKELVS